MQSFKSFIWFNLTDMLISRSSTVWSFEILNADGFNAAGCKWRLCLKTNTHSGERVSGERVSGERVSGEHEVWCCCVFSLRGVSCGCSLGVFNTHSGVCLLFQSETQQQHFSFSRYVAKIWEERAKERRRQFFQHVVWDLQPPASQSWSSSSSTGILSCLLVFHVCWLLPPWRSQSYNSRCFLFIHLCFLFSSHLIARPV